MYEKSSPDALPVSGCYPKSQVDGLLVTYRRAQARQKGHRGTDGGTDEARARRLRRKTKQTKEDSCSLVIEGKESHGIVSTGQMSWISRQMRLGWVRECEGTAYGQFQDGSNKHVHHHLFEFAETF